MSNASETPRTDARVWTPYSGQQNVVWASFARELERENAELRADKARLDWLEENMIGSFGLGFRQSDECPVHSWTFDAPVHDSVRAAIDAAMEAAK